MLFSDTFLIKCGNGICRMQKLNAHKPFLGNCFTICCRKQGHKPATRTGDWTGEVWRPGPFSKAAK